MLDQKSKIACWLGFEHQLLEIRQPITIPEWDNSFEVTKGYFWMYPDVTYHENLPDFYESFDECLKWIFPRLRELGWRIRLAINPSIYNVYTIHLHQFDRKVSKNYQISITKKHTNPARAVCDAVEEVIKHMETSNK